VTWTEPPSCNSRACGCAATTGWAAPTAWRALAWIAASRSQYERVAILLGAAAIVLQSLGTTLDGNRYVAGHHRDCERQARQALGEAGFQAANRRGRELPTEDALAYALHQPPERPPEKPYPVGHF
jgi:hypothetical protein